MDLSYTTKEEWMKLANEATLHLDAATANKLLRDWKTIHGSGVLDVQTDRRLEVVRKNLLFTAFALLDQEQASVVLKEYLFDFLKSKDAMLDPMEKIELRIKATGYGLYDQEREFMRGAVLSNKERIGGFSISDWIARFEKIIPSKPENKEVVRDFLTKDSEVANLQKDDQEVLQTLFSLYDTWLRSPVISIFDLAMMASGQPAGRSQSQTESRFGGQPSAVKLPLLQALSKYEQLGNQLITAERIKLRSQGETVRPSLLYWIKYYRDELGIGHHSTVERGNFLFRSENGKKLTPEERERVNLVLKSVEENYPVEVDTEQSVIIFPPFVASSAPTPQMPPTPPMAPQRSAAPSQAVFQPSRPSIPTPPAQPGSLTFTSSHVMPGEREAVSAPKNIAPRPVAPAQKSNPFHIRPVSLGEQDK